MTERWAFYVDESGKFDDAQDDVVVAGLLLRDSASLHPHAIKAALRRAIPLLPWPLHATFINQPAYVTMALEPAVRSDRQVAQTELGITVLQAWRLLKKRERDRVNAVARRLRESAEPQYDDIALLSSALRKADSLVFDRLRAHALETYAIAARLVSDLAASESAGLPTILLAAASETVVGDACLPAKSSDRYLQLLGFTLGRVRQVLA